MGGFGQFVPEAVLLVGVPVALLVGSRSRDRWVARSAAVLCVLAAAAAWYVPRGLTEMAAGSTVADPASSAARVAVCALAALWLAWVAARGVGTERSGEAIGLVLLSTVGGLILANAADLVLAFVAIELTVLPAYVLLGYSREDVPVLKGVLKQMTRSALASMIALYGMSFLYGLTGATSLAGIARSLPQSGPLGTIAAILTVGALLARLALLHRCGTGGSRAGAPSVLVAWALGVPAFSVSVFLARLSAHVIAAGSLETVLAVGAALSLAAGLYLLVREKELRELLTGAGVAHTGFIMAGLAALAAASSRSPLDVEPATILQVAAVGEAVDAVVVYAFTYSVAALTLGLLLAGTDNRVPWRGQRYVLWVAAALLASVAGVPPLLGFAGKWLLFKSLYFEGFGWLVVAGVLASAATAWHCARAVRALALSGGVEVPRGEQGGRAPDASGVDTGYGWRKWLSEDRLALGLAVSVVLVGGAAVWAVLG